MKPARSCLCIAIISVILFTGSAAHAGIPVFDGANLAQSIQQVVSWVQQYKQMYDQYSKLQEQYSQLQQTYNSATGTRNLGDVLNNKNLQGVVPQNITTAYNSVNTGGFNGLSTAAKAIRNQAMIYNCEDRTGPAKTACEAQLNLPAQSQAFQQNALDLAQQRTNQIQQLQTSINTTQDPKAIAELQARIAAEQAQVANDANRIALMNQIALTQQTAADQASRERALKMLNPNTPSALDTFVYQAP